CVESSQLDELQERPPSWEQHPKLNEFRFHNERGTEEIVYLNGSIGNSSVNLVVRVPGNMESYRDDLRANRPHETGLASFTATVGEKSVSNSFRLTNCSTLHLVVTLMADDELYLDLRHADVRCG
ncbi:MAG: hypothetical protein ACPHK8_02010, partial [Thermoplasmatota archaeon]